MPRRSHSIEIDATSNDVFTLVHDYDRRLEWDSMLSSARLLGGATEAGLGVTSYCVGTWKGLWLGFESVYVRFVPGEVAAAKMTNRPPFFESFGATMRHEDLSPERSRVTYIFSFTARPRFAAPLLEPIMAALLSPEVEQRLHALKRFLERGDDRS